MWKRAALVYMVSPTASTCNHYAARCTKSSPKILRPKNSEKCETHPIQPKKGETGCVLGAGEGENGCKQVRTDEKTRFLNESEPQKHTTRAKRKPEKTQCFRRFCGRGRRTWSRLPARVLLPSGERPAPTEAAAETGAVDGRHRHALAPRHALRRAQPCLVAKTFSALTKNGEVSARLTSPFLAGAEGVGLRSRSGQLAAERHWRSLPPRHAVLEWMWGRAAGSGGAPVSPGSRRKPERGRCWFGAAREIWGAK